MSSNVVMSVGMFDGSDDLLELRHLSHPLLPLPLPDPRSQIKIETPN